MAVIPTRAIEAAGERDRDVEGLIDYKRRCWEQEFKISTSNVKDPETRRALVALRELLERR